MSDHTERSNSRRRLPALGSLAWELAMNEAAGDKAFAQEYSRIQQELERKYQQAYTDLLRSVFHDLTKYVHKNRHIGEGEFKKGTDPIYTAMEFFISHSHKGNLIADVLEDQLEPLEYRALSPFYVVRILEVYRDRGLIPYVFHLPPSNELLAFDHEGLVILLTSLNNSYNPKEPSTNVDTDAPERSLPGEELESSE